MKTASYSNSAINPNTHAKVWFRAWPLIAVITISLLFLATRLISLTAFPVFNDETLYIMRAQATLDGDYFIGMRIGREGIKQLYIWLLAGLMALFDNALLLARLISVLSGFLAVFLCYKIADLLYGQRYVGLIAALYYLIFPFTLFYDRLGVMDSLLTMLMGATLLVSLQLWSHTTHPLKHQSTWGWAVGLGILFGLATLAKVYAVLYYPVPLLLWLLLGRNNLSWSQITRYLAVVYSVTLIMLSPLLMVRQSLYDQLQPKYAEKEIALPYEISFLERFGQNIEQMIWWLGDYLTWPIIGLLCLAIVWIVIKQERASAILLLLIGGTALFFITVFAILSASWYPRYLLPITIPVAVLLGHITLNIANWITLTWFPQTNTTAKTVSLAVALFLLCAIPALIQDYHLLTNPTQATLPAIERLQYFEGQHAGYGLPEIASQIQQMAQDQAHITVIGSIYANDLIGVKLHFEDMFPHTNNVTFHLLTDMDATLFEQLNQFAQRGPTLTIRTRPFETNTPFMVLDQPIPDTQIEQLATFAKPQAFIAVDLLEWVIPHLNKRW